MALSERLEKRFNLRPIKYNKLCAVCRSPIMNPDQTGLVCDYPSCISGLKLVFDVLEGDEKRKREIEEELDPMKQMVERIEGLLMCPGNETIEDEIDDIVETLQDIAMILEIAPEKEQAIQFSDLCKNILQEVTKIKALLK